MAMSKIEVINKIISERQYRKVKGKHGMVVLDMFTASCLATLYSKLTTPEAIQKFENASWEALGNYVYKKMGA